METKVESEEEEDSEESGEGKFDDSDNVTKFKGNKTQGLNISLF